MNLTTAPHKKLLALIAVAIVFCGAIPSVFATGYNYDIGVRARALGGAFHAIADDWTAVAYNPGGLAFIPDNQIGGNIAFGHNRWEYTPQVYFNNDLGDKFETGYANGRQEPNKHQIFSNPEIGAVIRAPIWGEMNLGFSIHQTQDQNVMWTLFSGNYDYSHAGVPQNQFGVNLDVVNFQATASKSFNDDKLGIGVGLALLRGDLVYNTVTLRRNPLDPSLVVRPFESIPEFTASDGNGWGFGCTAGALYKPTEKLNLALTFRPKSTITVSGRTNFRFNLPSDSVTFASTSLGQAEYYLTKGTILLTEADFESKIVTPTQFVVGSAYQLTDKWQVSLDVEYTLWSQFKGFGFDFTNFDSLNITAPSEPPLLTTFTHSRIADTAVWDDAARVMFGMSYKYKSFVTFMGGLAMSQSAATDQTTRPQFVDNGDKVTGSLGAHFTVNNWDLFMMGAVTNQPDLDVSQSNDIDNDLILDNVPGIVSGNSYQTAFGFTYRF